VTLIERPRATLLGRLGYFFEGSPAPDQQGVTNYADSAKHGFSAGFGVILEEMTALLPGPLSLDVSMQYLNLVEREYEKTEPADIVGDYFINGHVFGVGVQLGVSL
jgi:long-chain fatty acid transport protein